VSGEIGADSERRIGLDGKLLRRQYILFLGPLYTQQWTSLLTECRKEELCKMVSVFVSLAPQWQSRFAKKDMWLS
jgi:hypothetical protein